jgi:hypothetical protein
MSGPRNPHSDKRAPESRGIPTIAPSDGMGWRLRPGRFDHGQRFEDHDPRGRPKSRGSGIGGQGPGDPLEGRGDKGSRPYVELHCHTCYSFREGASRPRELLAQAAILGYSALAITDRDGLYGAMEFAKSAEGTSVRPIIGADVTLEGGYQLVLLAETRAGYANLCRLISGARLAEASVGDGGQG